MSIWTFSGDDDLSTEIANQGSLFTSDFLTETIQGVSEWDALGEADIDLFGGSLRSIFDRFRFPGHPMRARPKMI